MSPGFVLIVLSFTVTAEQAGGWEGGGWGVLYFHSLHFSFVPLLFVLRCLFSSDAPSSSAFGALGRLLLPHSHDRLSAILSCLAPSSLLFVGVIMTETGGVWGIGDGVLFLLVRSCRRFFPPNWAFLLCMGKCLKRRELV